MPLCLKFSIIAMETYHDITELCLPFVPRPIGLSLNELLKTREFFFYHIILPSM